MTWKVGQTVGQEYGHYDAKELRRSTVERVTPRGNAFVNGKFYRPNGIPLQRYGTTIFVWTDEHEARWIKQEAKEKRRAATVKAKAAHVRRERAANREAIDFGVELLENRVGGPVIDRLIAILKSIRPEEESDK